MDASYADAAGSMLRAGDRVQLVGTNKTGKCRFVGPVPFSDGIWVGLELGDASGRNDGSVQGRRYFSCKPRHGLFVRVSSCIKSSVSSTTTTPVREGPASASTLTVDQKTVDVSLGGSSTADVMLERIQTILGSARKPSSVSSSSTARTLLSAPSSSNAAPVPPIPMLRVDSAPAPIVDSGALLKDVIDSPVLQERIKKLVVAAVTTAIAASTPTPTPAPAPTPAPSSSAATAAGKLAAETAALVAGLEGRVAAMETAFDRIKAGLDEIQSLVSVKSAPASSLSSTPSRAAMKTQTPPRSRTDMGTETDSSADNAAEVLRLREALEVVSRLTREAQAGILAERTKRKEETEALLNQLSKVKSSPSR